MLSHMLLLLHVHAAVVARTMAGWFRCAVPTVANIEMRIHAELERFMYRIRSRYRIRRVTLLDQLRDANRTAHKTVYERETVAAKSKFACCCAAQA